MTLIAWVIQTGKMHEKCTEKTFRIIYNINFVLQDGIPSKCGQYLPQNSEAGFGFLCQQSVESHCGPMEKLGNVKHILTIFHIG